MTIEIELDCESKTCGHCQYVNGNDKGAVCSIFIDNLRQETNDVDGSFVGYIRHDECVNATKNEHYSYTVTENGDHLLGFNGKPLEFRTVNDVLEYLRQQKLDLEKILQCNIRRELIKGSAI